MRVADLARELGLSSADLMGLLDDLGITVVSDASMLQQSQVRAVRAQLSVPALARPEEPVVPIARVEPVAAPVAMPAPPSPPPAPAATMTVESSPADREWE